MAAELAAAAGRAERGRSASPLSSACKRGAGVQPVAQLAEVARAAAARRPAGQRAADVGQRLQRRAQRSRRSGVVVEPCDQRQPRLDRARGRSAARTVGGEQPPPGAVTQRSTRRAGCRRRRPSGCGRSPGSRGSPRRSPSASRAIRARRGEEGRRRPSGSRRDRRAGRPPRRARRGRRRRSRRASRPRTGLQPRSPARLSNPPCRPWCAMPGTVSAAIVSAGAEPRQLGLRARPARTRPARTGRSRCRRRRCPIVARARRPPPASWPRGFEQGLLGQRARRDDPDDRAVDHRLGRRALARFGRALDLLGDGDAVAGPDQPREIGLGGVDRHAAHRDRLAVMLAARGQRDVERRRGGPGVVEEQFEEIAHPVEQQASRPPP